jgi:hypothetical protein
MINKKCLAQIRDTEWERVLFPERGTPEVERALREFRKRMKEAYPEDDAVEEDTHERRTY